ncbi:MULTISPECIES: hypothetical protein [unclassified Streptomyces]|uniref:hypothetical protein n=1 Tax=unclassified Streptomyces TaxID=2593676 RepID=UPI000DDA46D2|nr:MULTISPECIES: hypothetical protein [unclassified Streptomyces]QZZ26583.1 hypothetical protein A7X85_10215 [Streptomyces sp. ST1015]
MTGISKRAELIAGLRALADALEADVSMPVPGTQKLNVYLPTNAQVGQFAAERGLAVEYDDEGNASVDITFGPMTYHVYSYADFEEHRERWAEKDARKWAERKGLEIRPAVTEAVTR